MKNAINYYYNIYVNEIIKKDDYYEFYFNNNQYKLVEFNRPYDDIKSIYKINQELLKNNILVHKIILNVKNDLITVINNINYCLLKICDYKNDKILLNDLKYYQNFTYNIRYDKNLLRNDWINLWCDKIDYYEYQISELGKKYKILLSSLSYYIGLGENAISFLINNINKYSSNDIIVVSHKRIKINEGSMEFYNPLNFVIDSRIRDLSEYIKNSFFSDQLNVYEIKLYLDNNNFNIKEYILLFSRLLFPTYYFDIYDEIINNNLPEDKIIKIIEKNDIYQNFLKKFYKYLTNDKKIFLEPIEWLIK